MELCRLSTSSGEGISDVAVQADAIRQRLGSALAMVDALAGESRPVAQDPMVTEKLVRTMLKVRRNRERFFKSQLFADPAWDMLLELYASELGQQRISISSLCLGAAVPATTALRWIATLEQEGLAERRPDPTDGRRYFVQLTRPGREAMADYFRTVPGIAPMI